MPALPPPPGRRIAVIGLAGTGKSYLARTLAERLGLHYIDRDALIVQAGWRPTPLAERVPLFEALTRADGWTFDGHLRSYRDDEQAVLARCDTVVWLDFPRWRVMASVVPRTLKRAITRERLWNGNIEGWQRLFSRENSITFSWKYYPRFQREYRALFANPAHAHRILIRFTRRADVNRWLAAIPQTSNAAGGSENRACAP
jgi:adenylate kinase family enzyme